MANFSYIKSGDGWTKSVENIDDHTIVVVSNSLREGQFVRHIRRGDKDISPAIIELRRCFVRAYLPEFGHIGFTGEINSVAMRKQGYTMQKHYN